MKLFVSKPSEKLVDLLYDENLMLGTMLVVSCRSVTKPLKVVYMLQIT